MTSATTAIRQFLFEAHRHINCQAVAYTSPSSEEFYFHSTATRDPRATAQMLRAGADTFLVLSRNRTGLDSSGPLILNRVRIENDGPFVGRFLIAPVPDRAGELAGIVMIFRDMGDTGFDKESARKARQLSIQLARVLSLPADPMTGLLERAGIEKLVTRRLSSLNEQSSSCVLYGDIDQLHVINDLLGFEAGDRAIVTVADALDAELANVDAVLSRLSGDRFTVFLPDCSLPLAQKIAEGLREAVQAASLLARDGDTFPLSICFGAAPLRAGERRGFDHALAAAEVACKAAKDRGRNRVEVYQATDVSMIQRRTDVSVVAQLRNAIEQGQYQIFAQPIASLLQPEATRRYEMLFRILDEESRVLLPSHFMSAATRYQLLPQIDRCVVKHVLGSLKSASLQPGIAPLHVSINLSGQTVSDPAFHDWLLNQIEQSGVAGERLMFELTEATAVRNLDQVKQLVQRLGERGCRFALDDFGTGLSSLTLLKDMNFSALKIDGSFIRDILHNERSQSLVRAIAQLAAALGMEVIAEYVETSQICMRLIELQVQYAQGYAIGKPKPLVNVLPPSTAVARAS
jgi:diguanylate cyclase (GGDEF)-like protein